MPNIRLPDSVHRLNGTYREDRHGSKEGEALELPVGYPEPPGFLNEHPDALALWRKIRLIMEPASIYTEADASTVARYCVLQSQFEKIPEEFSASLLAQLRLLESDLYLTPQSRAKLGVKSKSQENPFSGLIGNAPKN